ncbi:MAG: hypothetical protein K0U61_04690 [Alphaproteobacteria bacterium]|nr:hypothetical protein [Alphaproteobacteria bacterium]
MGGFGSGGWNLRHAGTVEGNRRLCADTLRKGGCLEPGFYGSITWTSDDGETNSIRASFAEQLLKLTFRYRINDGDWNPVKQNISVSSVACHYGGERTLFFCPNCGSRRKYLYGAGRLFLCRTCHDLTFSSQRERSADRACRRAQKLRHKLDVDLGLEAWIGPRPKGMHQKTFDRISREIRANEDVVLQHMWLLLHRINGGLPGLSDPEVSF